MYLFTSESVSRGHPDKVCDQISDAFVDRYMGKDPFSRVAVETVVFPEGVLLAGEVRGPSLSAQECEEIVRGVLKDIGYNQKGFHYKDVEILSRIHAQSADIAMGVDGESQEDVGAGDQGIMFGYACDETEAYMPATIHYAHRILEKLEQERREGRASFLGPDAKSQVTLSYEDGVPRSLSCLLLSTQHDVGVGLEEIEKLVRTLMQDVFPSAWIGTATKVIVNPTGRFVVGGPIGDSGLTGRKIIVDTYGGAAPHGGGAFSGKDPTKVDRSSAYGLRYLAKNVVASGISRRCTLQVSYAIGMRDPLSFYVNLHGTQEKGVSEEGVVRLLMEMMDGLTPSVIIEKLALRKPIYLPTASYGHFGRTPGKDGTFSWENTTLAKDIANDIR